MSPSRTFLSELIKQKLYTLIDRTAVSNTDKEKWLLFFLKMNSMKLDFFCKIYLSLKEFNVLYLGDNLPIDSLTGVAEKHKIDNILLSYTNYSVQMSNSEN